MAWWRWGWGGVIQRHIADDDDDDEGLDDDDDDDVLPTHKTSSSSYIIDGGTINRGSGDCGHIRR